MRKCEYSDEEKEINRVLHYQEEELRNMDSLDMTGVESCISESEDLLTELGKDISDINKSSQDEIEVDKPIEPVVIPSWETLCAETENAGISDDSLETLFTDEELIENIEVVSLLNAEYKEIYHLDKIDIAISAFAGMMGAAVDILLVGIPKRTPNGLTAKPLSNFIRDQFDKAFPPDEMEKLANTKFSKVPYDAQDNRNTTEYIDGLSAYYHRLLSLGHDPILGFFVGVSDILTGHMTTIDKKGNFVTQVIPNYADRTEQDVFSAIAKQVVHLKTDITTSMGLPAPLMSVFNLFQFGSIGEEEQTIAEIVQGMYYEGYDFIHFCSMSVPVMVIEVIVRVAYALREIKKGKSIKDAIPVSIDRDKHPKLSTMLFIGHSGSVAINAGKVLFTKNPMAINYPQWLAFAKYAYNQLKWGLIEKPKYQEDYVTGRINDELACVYKDVDKLLDDVSKDHIIIMQSDE